MKFKLNAVVATLIVTIICSCKFVPVLNKDETIDAAVGKWEHKDLNKSDVKAIIFTIKKNTRGDSLYIMQYKKRDSNGNTSDTGVWRYAGIGKIELSDIYGNYKSFAMHFFLANNHTMDLEYDDLYTKDN